MKNGLRWIREVLEILPFRRTLVGCKILLDKRSVASAKTESVVSTLLKISVNISISHFETCDGLNPVDDGPAGVLKSNSESIVADP